MSEEARQPSTPRNDKNVITSNLNFPIVGIGASAGGISAIQRIFEGMPAGNGMSFVVVLHLSPTHDSFMDQVLSRQVSMPVVKVTGLTRIEQEHVYVIAPNTQLEMSDGYLCLKPYNRPLGRHVPSTCSFAPSPTCIANGGSRWCSPAPAAMAPWASHRSRNRAG